MSLTEGRAYIFRHKRKGRFVAVFVRTEPGDPNDPTLLRVRIDTSAAGGQGHLANAVQHIGGKKGPALVTEKLIRPSMLSQTPYEHDPGEGR